MDYVITFACFLCLLGLNKFIAKKLGFYMMKHMDEYISGGRTFMFIISNIMLHYLLVTCVEWSILLIFFRRFL